MLGDGEGSRSSRAGHVQLEGPRAGSREEAGLNLPLETHAGPGASAVQGVSLPHRCSGRTAPTPTALLANFPTTEELTIPSAKPSAGVGVGGALPEKCFYSVHLSS